MIRKCVRRALVLLAAALFSQAALAQPSEADFTRQMAERFRAAMPGRTVEISGPLQLRYGTGADGGVVNVGRVFADCASATAQECETFIDEFVRGLLASQAAADVPITRDQLRVLVRAAEYCDHLAAQGPRGTGATAMRPYVPGTCALIMADYPTHMRGVHGEELSGMGLTMEEAWALAERQTLANLPRPQAIEGLDDGLVMVTEMDYVTSLLLDTEGWRAAQATHGDLFAAVPASDALVAGRLGNFDDLDALREVVRDHFQTASRGVSPLIYRLGPTGWVPID